jgi:hypothetical protein
LAFSILRFIIVKAERDEALLFLLIVKIRLFDIAVVERKRFQENWKWIEMNAGYKPFRQWYVVLPLILVIALICSCNKQEVLEVSKSMPSSVEIFNEDGKYLCTLKESEDGERLLWIGEGQEGGEMGSCGDEIKQRLSGPIEGIVAVAYVRNCGATVDYATCVDLYNGDEQAGSIEKDTIFVLEGYQPVEMEWSDDGTLVVNSPRMEQEKIYLQKEQSFGFKIEYRKNLKRGPESQYIALSSVNYGATGMAAGFSEEALLRMAGWHQMQSGLWRSEWGYWYGDSPYGDDPGGHYMIKQGIEYFRTQIEKKQ